MVPLADWSVAFLRALYKIRQNLLHFTLSKLQTTDVTMLTASQRSSRTALLPVLLVLFLFSVCQTVAFTDTNRTASSPAETNSSMSADLNNSMVGKANRPCGVENGNFCLNGGQCYYLQDRSEPSCHCQIPYNGPRCDLLSLTLYNLNESKELIAIILGVVMMIFALVIIIYFCFVRRCLKSAPLKTSSLETQV